MLLFRNTKALVGFVRLAAVAVAMLLVTVLIITQSEAAFSDTDANATNSFQTGSVVLTDDDAGVAMFTATGMSPGNPVAGCIELTYAGTLVPADIRTYATATGTLAQYLDLTIEIGTGATFGDCGSFVAGSTIYDDTLDNFAVTHTDWATGLATFTAAANPEVRALRFTVDVQDVPAAQADSATAVFTWEAQG